MKKLISKVQYNDFEKGEFCKIEYRDVNETIKLIEEFPWSEQRKNIEISLTNPSITIENNKQDYLKISTYYNGKYAIRFLDSNCQLYIKSIQSVKESIPSIIEFYQNERLETNKLKIEKTHLKNFKQHFESKNFEYALTKQRLIRFLISSSFINLLLSFILIAFFLFHKTSNLSSTTCATLVVILFLVGGGLNILLYINFYAYAKNKILIMSKGNDEFTFGDVSNLKQYNKKNILKYYVLQNAAARSPIGDFIIFKLIMNDNTIIKIPSILIDEFEFIQKLKGVKRIDKNTIPFIRN